MPTTPQGQITLAVISSQIADFRALLEKINNKLDEVKECQDKMDYIPHEVDALKKTVGDQGDTLIALKTRVDGIGALNSFLALIAGAIGSLFNPKL